GATIQAVDFTQLTSLDLTDKTVTSGIKSGAFGIDGSNLQVNSSGVATGGSINLNPSDVGTQLSALIIPKGVTVNFVLFNPKEYLIDKSSKQAIFQGNANFGGNTNSVDFVYNGPATTTAVLIGSSPTSTPVITSTGSLTLTSNAGITISGPMSVNTLS